MGREFCRHATKKWLKFQHTEGRRLAIQSMVGYGIGEQVPTKNTMDAFTDGLRLYKDLQYCLILKSQTELFLGLFA